MPLPRENSSSVQHMSTGCRGQVGTTLMEHDNRPAHSGNRNIWTGSEVEMMAPPKTVRSHEAIWQKSSRHRQPQSNNIWSSGGTQTSAKTAFWKFAGLERSGVLTQRGRELSNGPGEATAAAHQSGSSYKNPFQTIWVQHSTVRKIIHNWKTFKAAANLPEEYATKAEWAMFSGCKS